MSPFSFLHFISAHYISAFTSAKDKKKITSILSNLNNFHSIEVVDRVSETQLQVGENSD